MGLSAIWYSERARDEAVAEARKMNAALEKRVAELERIIGALSLPRPMCGRDGGDK
jgi:hypothetical protein